MGREALVRGAWVMSMDSTMKQGNGFRGKGMSVRKMIGGYDQRYDHGMVMAPPVFIGSIGRPMPTDGGVVESQVVWQ